MKKYILYSIVIIIGLVVFSCSEKKKTREERVAEFREQLSAADTTTMLKLCDDAMELLKNKQYNKVLGSMYEYTDSIQEAKPLTEKTASEYLNMFKRFPVLNYRRAYFSFQLEGCNDVKYMVEFATAEATGTGKPATTSYMFNPVKIDGTWKLCVKTPDDQLDLEKR